MNNLLTISILCAGLLAGSLHAQTQKGHLLLTADAHARFRTAGGRGYVTASARPGAQYFILDHWSAGGSLLLGFSNEPDSRERGIAAETRLFLPGQQPRRWQPYLTAAAEYTRGWSDVFQQGAILRYQSQFLTLRPGMGLVCWLVPSVGIDASLQGLYGIQLPLSDVPAPRRLEARIGLTASLPLNIRPK